MAKKRISIPQRLRILVTRLGAITRGHKPDCEALCRGKQSCDCGANCYDSLEEALEKTAKEK